VKKGKVYLVGAGPGDPKLMTLKGLECLRKAEVLVYDRLVNPRYLKEVPESCLLIFAGKASSNHTLPQEEINRILLEQAKGGKVVVRLKGGDPYVFGRGGEEGEVLNAHGIPFEVVPGVTSAIGGLAYAGIPITHRNCASSFHVITAHLKNGSRELEWDSLAKLNGTLVFLMGAKSIHEISQGLMKAGKAGATPVAFVHQASTPNQHVDVTTLEEMVKVPAISPVLIVIGDVVNLREKLNFFEEKPLFGKNVAVTRARKQNSSFANQLAELGAHVIEVPTIKVMPRSDQQPLKTEIQKLDTYQYVIFTSINTVEIFFKVLSQLGKDSRHLASNRVVAIGKQTAASLIKHGIKADLVPEVATLEGMVDLLKPLVREADHLLLPKAKVARTVLTDHLPGTLTEVELYETQLDDSSKEVILDHLNGDGLDYLTFSSSSTVLNFIRLVGKESLSQLEQTKIFSLGPITSATIKEAGLALYEETREPLMAAMLESLVQDVKKEEVAPHAT